MSTKAVILLANGFEEIEAITPIDILRRAEFEVTVAGVGGTALKGAHGLTVMADTEIATLGSDIDVLVLPGGMPGSKNLGESPEAKRLALDLVKAGKAVAAICAAPVFTLGAWGILSGKEATCFPGLEDKLPKDARFSAKRVVVDGKVITSRGAGTAMDFSLAIVALAAGQAKADAISQAIVYS